MAPFDPGLHRTACLALFDDNVIASHRPDGTFRPEERVEFQRFLDDLPGPYFVVTGEEQAAGREGGVVACGGWAREDQPGLLSLCWTVVAAARQGEGLGRLLVEGVVGEAREAVVAGGSTVAEEGCLPSGVPPRLRLDTIPATRGFFEAMGFSVVEVDPEGYGPASPPRVEMVRPL